MKNLIKILKAALAVVFTLGLVSVYQSSFAENKVSIAAQRRAGQIKEERLRTRTFEEYLELFKKERGGIKLIATAKGVVEVPLLELDLQQPNHKCRLHPNTEDKQQYYLVHVDLYLYEKISSKTYELVWKLDPVVPIDWVPYFEKLIPIDDILDGKATFTEDTDTPADPFSGRFIFRFLLPGYEEEVVEGLKTAKIYFGKGPFTDVDTIAMLKADVGRKPYPDGDYWLFPYCATIKNRDDYYEKHQKEKDFEEKELRKWLEGQQPVEVEFKFSEIAYNRTVKDEISDDYAPFLIKGGKREVELMYDTMCKALRKKSKVTLKSSSVSWFLNDDSNRFFSVTSDDGYKFLSSQCAVGHRCQGTIYLILSPADSRGNPSDYYDKNISIISVEPPVVQLDDCGLLITFTTDGVTVEEKGAN